MQRSRIIARTLMLGLVLMTQPAFAAQWREVGEVPDTGTIVFVDPGTMSLDHDTIVKGWVRFEYDKPHERDGHKFDSYASLRMVNCEANRYWQLDGWGYRNNAEPVRLYSDVQEWQTPAPDSENEIASSVLCHEGQSIFGSLWDTLAVAERLHTVWRVISAIVAH